VRGLGSQGRRKYCLKLGEQIEAPNGVGRGEGVPTSPPGENFFYSLVYKWLVAVHSETNLYTGRRAIECEIIII